MATITLQTSMSGPTDNAGTCRVLYQVVNADGLDPEIFVIKVEPPVYRGGKSRKVWQHVAYADEMTNVPLTPVSGQVSLVRQATAEVEYTSLENAETAIKSIRRQIQRLVNELKVLAVYTETNTWVISSTN